METQLLPYHSNRVGNKPQFVVVHWSGGSTIESAINTLKQRKLSYHYIIDGERVVKLVDESRAAYHAGVWTTNLKSIGICFVGVYEQPVKEASYQTGAQLLSDIHKRIGKEPSGETILPHRLFKPTACPGTLNVTRLITEARAIHFPPAPVIVPVEVLSSVEAPDTGPVYVTVTSLRGVRIRVSPDHNAALTGVQVLKQGEGFLPAETVTGSDPYGDGRNQWYRNENNEYAWKGAF